jgi:hypothetical protein
LRSCRRPRRTCPVCGPPTRPQCGASWDEYHPQLELLLGIARVLRTAWGCADRFRRAERARLRPRCPCRWRTFARLLAGDRTHGQIRR